ncbi:hypothetical protein [Pedobacter jamesrossensis]|uniref:Uncharacterized protein n=1 Tax=Pedobacter jamesrossensis TaxID=1908238 RepID=A0ABV8NK64_9SPHI
MKNIKIFLFLMILASVFSGVKLKEWAFLFQFEFIDFPTGMIGKADSWDILKWIILLISHAIIFSLPFRTSSKSFKNNLIFFPAVFIVVFSLFSLGFLLLLIPFILFWLISLYLTKKAGQ